MKSPKHIGPTRSPDKIKKNPAPSLDEQKSWEDELSIEHWEDEGGPVR